MQPAVYRIFLYLLIIIFASGCSRKMPPDPIQVKQTDQEIVSESDKEITSQMIEEYAMIHQMSDLKTAEFYLKNPDYARTHPYKPTREDRAFYERKFLEKMFPQFKTVAQKQGITGARSSFMNIDPHSDMPRSWKSRHRVDESFKKSAVIDTELTKATLLYKQNRIDEAIKSMETAVKADPESPTLLYDLGVMHMENESYPEAVDCFQRSLDRLKATGHSQINLIIHPKVYMGTCVNLGLVYMRLNMYAEAVNILKEALRFEPDDLEANWNLAVTYWLMGDMDGAAAQMRKYIGHDPDNAEAHNMIGLIYYRRKFYKAALDEFQIAAKLNPDDKQYIYNVGLLLAKLDRYDEASEAFKKAEGLEKGKELRQTFIKEHGANRIRRMYNDGCTAMENFDSARAIEIFQEVLELKPDMAEAHVNLGVLYRMRGDRSSQIHHFKEAAGLRPDSADIHYNLGLAYSDAGMYSEAMAELKQATELDPSMADAHFKLGTLFCKAMNFTDAIPKFVKCVELSPEWSKAHLNLGTCYLRTGNVDGAIAQFKEVVQLKPDSAEAYYSLGNAYMRVEKFDEASALFQKSLEIDPGYTQARTMLAEIESYQGSRDRD